MQLEDGTHIWLDFTNIVTQINEIACDENGNPIYDIIPYNPDNYGIRDMYQKLYDELYDNYSEDYDIIYFAYDWRLSCATAAQRLECVLSNYDECVLVAHSMGGLVASSYLNRSANNRAKVNKFISIGTPYTGAPKALYVIETGDLSAGTQEFFNFSEYALNIPAVYELLPTMRYFDSYTSYIYDDGTTVKGFDNSLAFMEDLDWAIKEDGTVKPMFDDAISFHNSLLDENGVHIVERSGVDTYKIFGYGYATVCSVKYDENGDVDSLETVMGDETVPCYSALNNASMNDDNVYQFTDTHVEILENDDCISLIMNIIDGNASTLSVNSEYALMNTNSSQLTNTSITVVTKKIESLNITNSDGCVLYIEGERVYYDDEEGIQHRVGSAWNLGNNSYQYLLNADDYIVSEITAIDNQSTIRIDYSDTGLTDDAISIGSLTTVSRIEINKNAKKSNLEISNNVTIVSIQ